MMKQILVISILFVFPYASEAAWIDWWQSNDQQAYELLQKEQYKEASEKFEEPTWKATAKYRSKNYEQAAKEFAQQGEYYNQGNALAQLGKINEAISAYKKTLKNNPNHSDAKHNLKILEQFKQQQKQQSNQQNNQEQGQEQQDQQQGQSQEEQQQNQSQDNQQNQQNNSDEQQSSLDEDKSHLDSAKKEAQEKEEKAQAGEESSEQKEQEEQAQKNADENGDDSTEQQQDLSNAQVSNSQSPEGSSTEQTTQRRQLTEEELKELEKNINFKQWLRTLPESSDSLLKRKFAYQYQKRRNNQSNSPQSTINKKW